MAIPEAQLETWANQGATTTSASTYASIKAALDRFSWPADVQLEVYLQGSYANATNIRGDSDVDVVVQLNTTFKSDIELLSPDERAKWSLAIAEPSYPFARFRSDVQSALEAAYGSWSVSSGSKSLKVDCDKHNNRLGADVVPCIQYRSYFRFFTGNEEDFVEGMTFRTETLRSRWIVNFPKSHRDNGGNKNSDERTSGVFKRTVRIFKNARNCWNDKAWGLREIEAPSYFVECLLSQVPDEYFDGPYQLVFLNVVTWLQSALRAPLATTMLCQNGRVPLFGSGPDQWDLSSAQEFVDAMAELWKTSR